MRERLGFFIRQHVAKIKSRLVWTYLMRHPEMESKFDLPYLLFKLVKDEVLYCPLCTLYFTFPPSCGCPQCPLESCFDPNRLFGKWMSASTEVQRAEAAREIVDKIKAWRIRL